METDLALLSRYHHHRDADAFRQIVEMHASMVHATARRVTQDAALAKDVAQETFLALARSSGSAIHCVGAWLHQAAWRKALMLVRSESRRHAYESAAAQQQALSKEAAWIEIEPVLDEALAELPEQRRNVLIERYLEGRTQQEIALRSGLSQSSVSRLLDQGLLELQVKLKSRGLITRSIALTTLLSTHATEAAPPTLLTSLGKLPLSGIGTTATTTGVVPFIAMLMKTKIATLGLATAAIFLAGAVGYQLSSPTPSSNRWTSPSPATSSAKHDSTVSTRRSADTSTGNEAKSTVYPATSSAGTQVKNPSPLMMAKLKLLTKEKDFKAFIMKVFALRDPARIVAEIQHTLGLTLQESMLAGRLTSPAVLEMAIFGTMAGKHPEEMLAWFSLYEGSSRMMTMVALPQILKHHPHLTAANIEAILPFGPNRETILALFRAQSDPLAEAAKVAGSDVDARTRQEQLWKLAESWPESRLAEGVQWAMQNLQGAELQACLPRLAQKLSSRDPESAFAVLAQIQDPDLLTKTLVDTMHSLVHEQKRMTDVLTVIDRLQGDKRAHAIRELGRRWVRVDQTGLMKWINELESPADFEAALPLTLPQLSPENYEAAMKTLMSQLDGKLDVALLNTAMMQQHLDNTTRTSLDIIRRFTELPSYGPIASGQSGNRDLLWQAVLRTTESWVKRDGAPPQQAAQWINSLPFARAADKIIVAEKLYQQWKVTDPAAAQQWAATTGIKIQ